MKFVGSLIAVDDIAVARDFYEKKLGQTVEFDFGENVSFVGGFAIHQRTHFQGLLGDAQGYPITLRANNGELYFEEDDLDPVYNLLKESGVEFVHTVREQPWGQRVFRAYDPDGHIVEIGETMSAVVSRYHRQGWSIKQICEKTLMPIEFVGTILNNA